ncbi:MAG TPA: hypothetical protein VFU70_07150 [Pseudolabrys sp.]|jgi:hypothetical protein|nr:hypothetical protein [Pseudolabrys sp.]
MERRRIGCFLPFEGSMANPMIAACQNRETGRRALFLRSFADDREGK